MGKLFLLYYAMFYGRFSIGVRYPLHLTGKNSRYIVAMI